MKRLNLFTRKNRKGVHGAASRSQALLEFALALPILLMLIFGIIDLAALFQAWLTVENIARQTVRYAVTGQYELAFCEDGPDAGTEACEGDGYEAEQDAARLKSVQDYADRQTIALFYTPGAQQPEIGYLNVTICSTRDADPEDDIPDFTFYESSSANYADCQKNGLSANDAGAPGDRVIIAVDFNHPYITPIFNQVWPMTHLFSHREGIVEMFRVPRLIALPPDLPTSTLSGNEPATATPRITDTPPPTNTPPPIHIEITSPAQSGLVVTNVSQTNFEAVAWNPPFGGSNGDGISEIAFWFTGPATIPGRSDTSARFCAFGAPGNSACRTVDEVVRFTSLANGTYTIYARARGVDGRYSEIVSKTFILQFPPTATPTITHTPTPTPLPSCNDVFITDSSVRNNSNASDFRVTVRNNNQAAGILTSSTMTWNAMQSPPLYFDFFWFLNADSANRYHNPSSTTMFAGSNPAISWSSPTGAPAPLAGEAKTIWGSRFQRSGQPFLSGNFNVSLTFFFPELGECVVSTTLVQPTPSPTPIPPTQPPTPTPICQIAGAVTTTDFNGNPQNVNGYDCAFGCIRSPYLKSNQLPPGNYFWTLSTVGNNATIVNNGTFSLNPGQQAGPPSGVIVPLGRNMYNVPPGYFPGEFKVSVYQSADPGCNAKTDNLKIQAQVPTPEPTNIPTTPPPTSTRRPTSTPAPTNTPTPTPTRTPGGFDN
jgi:hypothetical protein